jgi:phenylacetic acid degradation operon negative regulatory protein
MKKLRLKDRLLLGFGLFYDYVGRHMLLAARGSYKACLFSPPKHRNESIYNAVSNLLKTGYLEKKVIKGIPYLRISGSGLDSWKRNFSFLATRNKPWDRSWRIVIFDFPEKIRRRRDSLRSKLYELGFGQMQKSIYISPFDMVEDMVEFLKEQKLLGYAYVLTAKHRYMGDPKKLAVRVWNLENINQKYKKIINNLLLADKYSKRRKLRMVRKLFMDLENLIFLDPFLPKELLPENWLGEKARRSLMPYLTSSD